MNSANINNNNTNFNKSGGDEGVEAKLLEEIKKSEEKYTFEHIPIKLCFLGTSFSGRKTQSELIKAIYPNIKIYNVEKIINECLDVYYKIMTPLEEQPRYKLLKKNQKKQTKQEKKQKAEE